MNASVAVIGQDCATGGQGAAHSAAWRPRLSRRRCKSSLRSCSSSGPKNKRNKSNEGHGDSHRGRSGAQDAALTARLAQSPQPAARAEPGRILRGSQQGSCAATPQAVGGTAAHYACGRGQPPGGLPGSTGCACPVRCSKLPSSRPVGGEARREQPGAPGKEAGRLGSEPSPSRRRCPLPDNPHGRLLHSLLFTVKKSVSETGSNLPEVTQLVQMSNGIRIGPCSLHSLRPRTERRTELSWGTEAKRHLSLFHR